MINICTRLMLVGGAMVDIDIPSRDQFFNPVLQALRNLGGSSTIEEMVEEVSNIMGFTEEQRQKLHTTKKRTRSVVDYRTAWARSYLKKYGLINNSSRGVWVFTQKGLEVESVDPSEVLKHYRNFMNQKNSESNDIPDEDIQTWKDELMDALLEMESTGFEKLSQRVLREAGFTHVEVTGRTGDGGIDGIGIMKIGRLLSFRILFQCKRHQSSIGSTMIRDFRGALEGRADKGIFITTSRFTRDAEKEATRDGATPIELVNGEELMDLLKQFDLGVKTEEVKIEKVTIDKNYFLSIL